MPIITIYQGASGEGQELAETVGRDKISGPATELMLDLAYVRTDIQVLDVAARTRHQTLFVARRVACPVGRGHTA